MSDNPIDTKPVPKPIIVPDSINRKALIIFVLVIALLIFVFLR